MQLELLLKDRYGIFEMSNHEKYWIIAISNVMKIIK